LKLAIDVHYEGSAAVAAGILFPTWSSDEIYRTIIKKVSDVAPYEPGSFYKRELPCILKVLEEVTEKLDVIIIDGFVMLGNHNEESDGLGMHLYNSLNNSIPIIGVAKKAFVDTPTECEVYRGGSNKPLYITSIGINLVDAKKYISKMHGKHRNPTLLKKVDQLCRGIKKPRRL